MSIAIHPWHDTPTCGVNGCAGPMVCISNNDDGMWNHRAKPGDRTVCCACGEGRVGTDAEYEQAAHADAAWYAVAETEYRARRAETREGVK